ncbi:hypothetical protein G7Y79_00029g063060 [Physcia stellaris]|nr:hypothetical protein G7Y79_00029g063060 [Physcia stellaris]
MDEDNGKHYAAILTLGSGQNFNVLVDTGSTDLFLPAAGAGPHNTVQPDPSIVPYPGSPACMENYGGNSQRISGTIYTAPFTFAGTTTGAGSPFCLVSDLGGYKADEDGVLGLQPCLSGIYLSSDDLGGGGFITPNDVNRDLFDGDFKWETIVGGAKHWTFSLGSAQWYVEGYVDNLASQYAFIDTGNPTVKLDSASVDKIWASIGAEPSTGAMNCTDKGSAPDITFTFGSGNEYTIPSSM